MRSLYTLSALESTLCAQPHICLWSTLIRSKQGTYPSRPNHVIVVSEFDWIVVLSTIQLLSAVTAVRRDKVQERWDREVHSLLALALWPELPLCLSCCRLVQWKEGHSKWYGVLVRNQTITRYFWMVYCSDMASGTFSITHFSHCSEQTPVVHHNVCSNMSICK